MVYKPLGSPSLQFNYPVSDYNPTIKTPCPGFVTIRQDEADGNNHFYLGDRLFDFRGFNAPTLLDGSVFETEDLLNTITGFGTPVTRTYTLFVSNTAFGGHLPDSNAHITGWDYINNDWIYNEEKFAQFDRVLDMASKHGVKLIIPMINQDYGTSDTDFVGNFNDLIRHRYNISSYRIANTEVDWFTDEEMRCAYKKIIRKLLTRRNTFNGKIYGEDDTIFAWETGNEMNWGRENNTIHDRPAPAEWTIDVASYIKSLAPSTLVMDGSYSRNFNESSWPLETLQSEYVDILSYHLYGDPDLDHYNDLRDQILEANKILIIGEHGFYSDAAIYEDAFDLIDCPGALIWSLRPHNEIGGFTTHSEGSNIYSYHVPGWARQTSTEFDTLEERVVRLTYEASYDIIDQLTPLYPIPCEPYPYFATNNTHSGLTWKGAAWAKYYEIWAVGQEGGTFVRVATHVHDNTKAGEMFVALNPSARCVEVPELPAVPTRSQAGWVDQKWSSAGKKVNSKPRKMKRSEPKKRSLEEPPTVLPTVERVQVNHPIPKGPGWYIVRGVSADGYPGAFSKPTYISIID